MTSSIIIFICVLLLLSYIFDFTASKSGIPSVLLLLILGWNVQLFTSSLGFELPDLSFALKIMGTLGLILIVLEGSLELELNSSKIKIIKGSAVMSFLPMMIFSVVLSFAIHFLLGYQFKTALSNAIPLGIISSAIAIPSSRKLGATNKEFVTYESSLSDIIGVILFNFVTLNESIGVDSIGIFFLELIIMIIISLLGTIILAYLLRKINHHVKFLPIILICFLIYGISKHFHLPALLFILFFGLALGNIKLLDRFTWFHKIKPEILRLEIPKFRQMVTEIAFLIRSLFFLLFGYLINIQELFNTETLIWSLSICIMIYVIRFAFLKLLKIEWAELLFIAPRGLITILLFLSIPQNLQIPEFNRSLIIQVIIMSILMIIAESFFNRKVKSKETAPDTVRVS